MDSKNVDYQKLQVVQCPLWLDKGTSFEISMHPHLAFDQVLNLLKSLGINFKVSCKKLKVKARMTIFVDFCDFILRIYAGSIVEMQFQNGSKFVFFDLLHAISNHFKSCKKEVQITKILDPSPHGTSLTRDETIMHWNQTIASVETATTLDMQYQCFQGITQIAYELPLINILDAIDLKRLSNLILTMIKSKDLEIVRFGCLLLKLVGTSTNLKEHFHLLQTLHQVLPITHQTTHLLEEIDSLLQT